MDGESQFTASDEAETFRTWKDVERAVDRYGDYGQLQFVRQLECSFLEHSHVSGERAGTLFTADHIFDYIEIDEQHAIFEVQVPEAWIGKSVGELDIRRKFGINILGIKRAGKTDVSVTPDTILSDDITILALGEYKALQKCFRI